MYDLRDYVTLGLAAEELGVEFRTLQSAVHRERLKAVQFERINHLFIHREELARFKAERAGRGRPKKKSLEN